MTMEPVWERALRRYADTVYRLALVRDPRPKHAAQATAAAFTSLDWSTVTLDERLEGRLLAALPPLRRHFRRPSLPPVPAAFWRLPPATRLALGLRLTRGYTGEAIGAVLGRPVAEVQHLLGDALAVLAGDDPAQVPEACRQARAVRLDEAGAGRSHVLQCTACQAAVARWDGVEQGLAEELQRAVGRAALPRSDVEAITRQLRRANMGETELRRQPALRWAVVILAVVVVVAVLVAPRGRTTATTEAPERPDALLRQAIAQYGTVPKGEGIVHRRYSFDLPEPWTALTAEAWTDAAQPARHRMQLAAGQQVQEWQVGDGERSLRYLTYIDDPSCGRSRAAVSLLSGDISTWAMDAASQEQMRAARWQFGPWAMGQRYLEQALAAGTLRSLGTVPDGEVPVLTLAAEGQAISGTLLIKLDARTAELREVREVTTDNGTTRSRTRWRLLSEEQLTPRQAIFAGVFLDVPIQPRPEEVKRTVPLLDPACPLVDKEQTVSLAKTLARGWPAVIGFRTTPPEISRIYLEGRPRSPRDPAGYPEFLTLVHVGREKRLAIRTDEGFRRRRGVEEESAAEVIAVGNWLVELRAAGPGRFEGMASARAGTPGPLGLRFGFFAEGWPRENLLHTLGQAQLLRLADWHEQRGIVYDPDPLPGAVVDLLVPATRLLIPRWGASQHALIAYEKREHPDKQNLQDPYHAETGSGTTETWAQYGGEPHFVRSWSERLTRFRSEDRAPDGTLRRVQWGTGGSWQIFYPRLDIVRRYEGSLPGTEPAALVGRAVADIVQYEQFQVSQDAGQVVTLQSTFSITESGLLRVLQQQRDQASDQGAWPWIADLDPQSVTRRTTFDRAAKRILRSEVYVNGPHGATLIERTTFSRFETGVNLTASQLSFTPPPEAHAVNASTRRHWSWQGPQMENSLAEAVAAVPAQLWGWPDGDAPRFVGASVPHPTTIPEVAFQTLDTAVAAGVAVQLRYDLPMAGHLTLVEGSQELLQLVLQQTPAAWTRSEERSIPIAGADRPAWIMHDADDGHWAIFELEKTLIVAQYKGKQFDEAVLPALGSLEPLR